MSLDFLTEYGDVFIEQLIGTLLTDKKYLDRVYSSLNVEDYENPSQKWIVNTIIRTYKKYRTFPTKNQLDITIKKEYGTDSSTRPFVLATNDILTRAYEYAADITTSQFVKDEYIDFCRNQAIVRAAAASMNLVVAKDYDAIRKLMSDALTVGNEQNYGHIYEEDEETRYREEIVNKYSFPFEKWTERTDGGLRKGLFLILGSPGGGKSWLASYLSAHYRKMGLNVLMYSAELDELYLGKRHDAILVGKPVKELTNYRELVRSTLKSLNGRLFIRYLNRKERTMAFIESNTQWLISEGFEPHVIIIDYLDKFKMNTNDKQAATVELYDDARDWAMELEVPLISPVQLQRGALRDAVVEGDKVGGYYEKLQIADLWWSIGRTTEMKQNRELVIHWGKNRWGEDGMSDHLSFDASSGQYKYLGDYVADDSRPASNGTKSNGNSIPKPVRIDNAQKFKQLVEDYRINEFDNIQN